MKKPLLSFLAVIAVLVLAFGGPCHRDRTAATKGELKSPEPTRMAEPKVVEKPAPFLPKPQDLPKPQEEPSLARRALDAIEAIGNRGADGTVTIKKSYGKPAEVAQQNEEKETNRKEKATFEEVQIQEHQKNLREKRESLEEAERIKLELEAQVEDLNRKVVSKEILISSARVATEVHSDEGPEVTTARRNNLRYDELDLKSLKKRLEERTTSLQKIEETVDKLTKDLEKH
jgi:hypothetical protein